MKRNGFVVATLFVLTAAAPRLASGQVVHLRAELIGANEVPPISSSATGTFTATISKDGDIQARGT